MRIRRKAPAAVAMPEREADLCERFAAAARDQGWTVFPEVSGWDLVLVWRAPSVFEGPQEGDQLAIEAKLRPSVEALAQTHQRSKYKGPDFRGVLVPEASRDFDYLARELRLHVFDLKHCGPWHPKKRSRWDRYDRPRHDLRVVQSMRWKRERKGLWLPPVPMSGTGGMPCPRQLTQWRIGALKLCILLRSRGFLTSEDFKTMGVHPARWPVVGWLVAEGKIGRLTRYIAGPTPLPDVGYEIERDALAAL